MAELSRIEVVLLLRETAIFGQCSAEEILRIAAISHQETLAREAVLFEPGDPADSLFCVVSGEVEVSLGERRANYGPGRSIGVLDLLCDRPRTRQARATAETCALRIDGEDFFDLLSNNIDIVRVLFRHLLNDASDAEREAARPL